MHRQLKFKAWNYQLKKMYLWRNIVSDKQILQSVFGNESLMSNPPKPIWNRLQFTGCKDSKGNSIFEGDILESVNFNDYKGKQHKLRHVVEWSDMYCGWYANSIGKKSSEVDGCCQLWVYMRNAQEPVVIGNIFENPEMMESK